MFLYWEQCYYKRIALVAHPLHWCLWLHLVQHYLLLREDDIASHICVALFTILTMLTLACGTGTGELVDVLFNELDRLHFAIVAVLA
jgi:hypothetical protein